MPDYRAGLNTLGDALSQQWANWSPLEADRNRRALQTNIPDGGAPMTAMQFHAQNPGEELAMLQDPQVWSEMGLNMLGGGGAGTLGSGGSLLKNAGKKVGSTRATMTGDLITPGGTRNLTQRMEDIQLPSSPNPALLEKAAIRQSRGVQPPVQGPVRPPVQGPSNMPIQGPANMPVQGAKLPPIQGPTIPPMQGAARPPMQGPANLPIQGPGNVPMQGAKNMPIQGPKMDPSYVTPAGGNVTLKELGGTLMDMGQPFVKPALYAGGAYGLFGINEILNQKEASIIAGQEAEKAAQAEPNLEAGAAAQAAPQDFSGGMLTPEQKANLAGQSTAGQPVMGPGNQAGQMDAALQAILNPQDPRNKMQKIGDMMTDVSQGMQGRDPRAASRAAANPQSYMTQAQIDMDRLIPALQKFKDMKDIQYNAQGAEVQRDLRQRLVESQIVKNSRDPYAAMLEMRRLFEEQQAGQTENPGGIDPSTI